ncbi:DUF1365 domain-containing protein [Phytomonospora endophytica]|uniref:DUF1365 domain-containing protein n=1 Tax=Phytomonospora endophytica TaxID=714109 RepID=A0A841FQY1_9ACTN|nr:DUF1365 domain-containing protein [Phytomonospora endophytica]MBB6038585.1 hypothetical protein [Phytomonospora endophytica]GIG69272.1 DUF1365 domain-containing protein [Phytomonospora endophytica]
MSGWAAGAALYRCEVRHVRTHLERHSLRHRTYMWLVDIDDMPTVPWPLSLLAGFARSDQLAAEPQGLRAGLDAYLADEGVDLDGGRVLLLTHARVAGYVFNPLSVYWCHDPQGRLVCVAAEVHNTYGGRHRYLLRPDADGRLRADKAFYVSPFLPVDGEYTLRLPEPGRLLDITVRLDLDGTHALTATVKGTRLRAGTATLLRESLRKPLSTLAVSLAIRWHGVRLLLKGLPRHPRPIPRKATRDSHHRTGSRS